MKGRDTLARRYQFRLKNWCLLRASWGLACATAMRRVAKMQGNVMARDYDRIQRNIAEMLADSGVFEEFADISAQVEVTPFNSNGNTMLFNVSWIIHKDSNRPDIPCTPIRIAIEGDITDSIDRDGKEARTRTEAQIVEAICKRMKHGHYCEDTGVQKGQYVMPFDIIITADDLTKLESHQ